MSNIHSMTVITTLTLQTNLSISISKNSLKLIQFYTVIFRDVMYVSDKPIFGKGKKKKKFGNFLAALVFMLERKI